MRRPKRQIEAKAEIDGFRLTWRLHREQQFSSVEGWLSASIHVQSETNARRDLHLLYPLLEPRKQGLTQIDFLQLPIKPQRVESHIRQAMEAGWDPDSRGKPFVFEVPELPG